MTKSNGNHADCSSSTRAKDPFESRPERVARAIRCESKRFRLLINQKAASRSLLSRYHNEQVNGFCQAIGNLQIQDANENLLRSQEFPLQLGPVSEPSPEDLAEDGTSGISYICSSCGALLYHIRPHGASGTNPALQPAEVAARIGRCRSCGHVPTPESDLEKIKISVFGVE